MNFAFEKIVRSISEVRMERCRCCSSEVNQSVDRRSSSTVTRIPEASKTLCQAFTIVRCMLAFIFTALDNARYVAAPRALVEENVKQTIPNTVSSQLIVEVSRVLITVNV